ncbi:hypothetical protein EVAR_60963_1 [Eumeta japonica]|uniref:Uncharacterized protein n=1 Tax=Eumeta variegata TaxID=151549 RepID=A0A4C1XSH4_EUMVA|nr:hypothetical protein EVAR_60963_1 [Eumeta japonica]
MSHRTRERPAECLASLSHSTMIGLPRSTRELVHSLQMYCKLFELLRNPMVVSDRSLLVFRPFQPWTFTVEINLDLRLVVRVGSSSRCRIKVHGTLRHRQGVQRWTICSYQIGWLAGPVRDERGQSRRWHLRGDLTGRLMFLFPKQRLYLIAISPKTDRRRLHPSGGGRNTMVHYQGIILTVS